MMTNTSTSVLEGDQSQSYSPTLLATITLMAIFAVVGTLGNSLVVFVYGRLQKKKPWQIFVLMLAVTDLIVCVGVIPSIMTMEMLEFRSNIVFCKWKVFGEVACVQLSVLISTAIAVERLCSIWFPFRQIWNSRRTIMVCLLLSVIAMAFGTVVALAHTVGQRQPSTDITDSVDGFCSLDFSILSRTFMRGFQRAHMAVYFIALIIITILYILIYIKILTTSQLRKSPSPYAASMAEKTENVTLECENLEIGRVPVQRDDKVTGNITGSSDDPEPKTITVQCEESGNITVHHENGSFTQTGNVQRHDPETGKSIVQDDFAKNTPVQHDDPESRDPILSWDAPGPINTSGQNWDSGRGAIIPCQNPVSSRSRSTIENIRVATMLFAVTVIFIICYTPAFLMSHNVVLYNVTVFYMYFLNNVTNPVIYAFVNANFRNDAIAMVKRCTRCQ